MAAIKESLIANGQYKPIVVNQRTMEVLVGNHTLRAPSELGWEEIDVSFVDAAEELAKRIVLVDNRTSDLADYDASALAELLAELPSLDGSGYDLASVDELLAELGRAGPSRDEVPPVPGSPRTQPGELVELGRHRLVCGDARDASCYAKLLDTDASVPVGVQTPASPRAASSARRSSPALSPTCTAALRSLWFDSGTLASIPPATGPVTSRASEDADAVP